MFDRVTTACALAATAAVVVWYWRRASRHWRERDIAFRQGTHQQQRRLGQSSVYVTVLGQGGAPLGDMYVKLDDATATGALSVAHEAGITLFDTAPWYGVGLSEARFGVALHRVPRDSFSLQTKVGRFLVPDPAGMNGKAVGWIGGFHNRIAFDYTAAGFVRQLEDSLQRTGLGRIDSVVIHDLEPTPHRNPATGDTGLATAHAHLAQLRKSGFAALQRLRAAGKISAIGAGLNIDEDGEDPQLKREWNQLYVDALLGLHTGEGGAQPEPNDRGIDFLLVANMHSLVCFEALDSGILTKCTRAGVSIIIGGPYSSGILATGSDPADGTVPKFNYEPASDEVRARTRQIEAVCKRFNVPLIASALQFPLLRDDCVACVIPGAKSPAEVHSNVANMNVSIPDAFWEALIMEGLIPAASIRTTYRKSYMNQPES